jgi:hypothetical protein
MHKRDIKIHKFSSMLDGTLLFWHGKKLYRSPFPVDEPLFKKAEHVKCDVLQPMKLIKERLVWPAGPVEAANRKFPGGKLPGKDIDLPVYEHTEIYDHLVRINELPITRRKRLLAEVCRLQAEAVGNKLLLLDIHEDNVFDTPKGVRWLDTGSFSRLADGRRPYLYVCALTHWYVVRDHSPQKRNFKVDFTENSIRKGPLGKSLGFDFTRPDSWMKLGDMILGIGGKLKTTEWTEYPDKMVAVESPDHSDKSNRISEIIQEFNPETLTDIGCHIGYYSFLASQGCKSVVGIDIDETCVHRAIRHARKNDLNCCFANMNVKTLLRNEKNRHHRYRSDMVMAMAIVHHLHKDSVTPPEFAKLLKSLAKKYIFLEHTGPVNREVYENALTKMGCKLVKRVSVDPHPRGLSVYRV